jgi:cytochrome o ubiquinol oxidase operon protein cyoD
MSNIAESGKAKKTHTIGSVKTYAAGFVMSIALTLLSFGVVQIHIDAGHETFSHRSLAIVIFVFAITQLAVQLVFFLHLGREKKPYGQSLIFMFTAFIITLLVVGSLWIMANLDYSHGGAHSLPSQETDTQIIHDEGIHR